MVKLKKLFLASWFAGSATLLPSFVGEDLLGKKVVFIPTASMYKMSEEERAGYDFINNLDKEALQSLGLVVDKLDVAIESAEKIERSIINADCIFVGGGSTFFLLQELKRKGADKLISQPIEQGKLFIKLYLSRKTHIRCKKRRKYSSYLFFKLILGEFSLAISEKQELSSSLNPCF